MVRIRAKATDPRIVPAMETMESSLLETVHFFLYISENILDKPKIAVKREMTQINNSKPRKVKLITSVVR